MKTLIPYGDCWFCKAHTEFEKCKDGSYQCSICKTGNMNPTYVRLYDEGGPVHD